MSSSRADPMLKLNTQSNWAAVRDLIRVTALAALMGYLTGRDKQTHGLKDNV